MKPSVLMLSAERPYPLHGGGAYRTASLLHYFAQFAEIDLILLAEDAIPSPVPEGLLRSQKVIQLAKHHKNISARYRRNAWRAILGIPPLIDRLSGLSAEILQAMEGRTYDLGIVEHFWCAPYIEILQPRCGRTVLNLHNVESELHRSFARLENPLIALGHRRFAASSEKLENKLLPRYSMILVTSPQDQMRVKTIAPSAVSRMYPNALPWVEQPQLSAQRTLVLAANFEYHPNIDAVSLLIRDIWPRIHQRHPQYRLQLVGRGDRFVRHLIAGHRAAADSIEFTGAVPDTLPYVASATVVLAPLRAGSGTRVKILEAWSAARAVVAPPLAAEGLDARNEENMLIAGDPALFADAVCRCIENQHLRNRLGQAGRQTFEDFYSWPRAWQTLDFDKMLATESEPRGYTGTF